MEYEERIQIIILGETFTGKTSLMQKYTSGFFTNQSIPTIGIDYATKKLRLDGKNYLVKIWDTAGQERYRSLTTNFYRNADGVIIVYDVTDLTTFEKVRGWIQSVNENNVSIQMVLVGNKADLKENIEVYSGEGKTFSNLYNIPFFETSAKDNLNVDDAFEKLISLIIERIKNLPQINEEKSEPKYKNIGCCL